jgi:hypothetical protein
MIFKDCNHPFVARYPKTAHFPLKISKDCTHPFEGRYLRTAHPFETRY